MQHTQDNVAHTIHCSAHSTMQQTVYNAVRNVQCNALTTVQYTLYKCHLQPCQLNRSEGIVDFSVDVILLCLQVIPELFFNMVEVVSTIHETHALSLPDRPEKAQLREYAHLPQRAELAQLTQQLAAYAGNLKAFDR